MTSNGKPVILIVDDAPVNVRILYELLSGDHCIKVADSGASALELAADDPRPDLILLDVMMPGMDGYEVCRRLKEKEITRDIPVIFITTMAEEDDEARGLDLGAVDYIVKPFRPRLVQARVHNLLCSKGNATRSRTLCANGQRNCMRPGRPQLKALRHSRKRVIWRQADIFAARSGTCVSWRNPCGSPVRKNGH